MTEDVLHFDQTRSRFDHIGRRIVPQVMPLEIGYARPSHERAEAAAQPFVWFPSLVIEEQIRRPSFPGFGDKAGNRFVCNFIQRNPVGLPTFGFSEEDGSLLKIDLLDLQVESFTTAHSGVPCEHDEGLQIRRREIDDFFQSLFFIGLEISNSLVVLLELLHQPDGVFHRLALQDRQLEDFAQRRQFTIDSRFAALRPAFADSITPNVFILFNEQRRDFGEGSFPEELAEGFDEVLVVLVRKLVLS